MRCFKGVEANELGAVKTARGKMRPQFCPLSPAEKENGGGGIPGCFIKLPAVVIDIYRKSPMPEALDRTPEAGTEGTVDQGQLMLIIGNQILNVCVLVKQMQGIIGGDPAAACGSGGTKSIAPLAFWNIILIVDEVNHG